MKKNINGEFLIVFALISLVLCTRSEAEEPTREYLKLIRRISEILFVDSNLAENICELPQSELGTDFECMAIFYNSIYFNKDAGECQKKVYAGCSRTANNFSTMKECEEACGG